MALPKSAACCPTFPCTPHFGLPACLRTSTKPLGAFSLCAGAPTLPARLAPCIPPFPSLLLPPGLRSWKGRRRRGRTWKRCTSPPQTLASCHCASTHLWPCQPGAPAGHAQWGGRRQRARKPPLRAARRLAPPPPWPPPACPQASYGGTGEAAGRRAPWAHAVLGRRQGVCR